MTETEIQQLARITGVDERTVAAVFAEPVPGQLRPDEIEDARRRVEVGEQAEAELSTGRWSATSTRRCTRSSRCSTTTGTFW